MQYFLHKIPKTIEKLASKETGCCRAVGIADKTTAAGMQLEDLSLVEHLIAHTLRAGMAAGYNYRDIYQSCKDRLEAMPYLQCTA